MKKILACLTAILMVLPLVACQGDTVTETDTTAIAETGKNTETIAETETEPVTETETEQVTETETDASTQPVYMEKTAPVSNIQTWTFDDAFAGMVVGVYCETEPNATVILRDLTGAVVMQERAIDRYFFGRFIMPTDQPTATVYFYAQSDGKEMSDPSRPVTMRFNEAVGANAMIAHGSHVFLNWYRDHYDGWAVVPGETEGEQKSYMLGVKNYLHAQLDQIREVTGKNTKIIVVVCTNPATVYHEFQYSVEEGGWGDHVMPTSTTQFAEYMKDDEDIYILDLRELLEANKNDRLLFMQADSHWTQVAAYYAYYLAAQKVQKDFPDTNIYDLDRDFETQIVPSGGDLLNFMGASALGVSAATASVTWKDESMAAPENAPTAYVMGDSYYGAINMYFDLLFSEVFLNTPDTNPPLYDYTLAELETRQPDYLFYVWTERNVDAGLSMLTSSISAGNIR